MSGQPACEAGCRESFDPPVTHDMARAAAPDRRPRPAGVFTHRNLPQSLLQARETVIARFRPILNAHGVTEQQWRIMRALLEAGSLEPREIVVRCAISSPSLAGVLARMEDLGLVDRERLDHDQRRLRVSLAARGRTVAARMAPQVEAVYAEIEARLGRPLMDRLHALLDELNAALSPTEDDGAGD